MFSEGLVEIQPAPPGDLLGHPHHLFFVHRKVEGADHHVRFEDSQGIIEIEFVVARKLPVEGRKPGHVRIVLAQEIHSVHAGEIEGDPPPEVRDPSLIGNVLVEHQGDLDLYLIDLARMFSPRWRRFRWRVKDLAQLKYSMPAAWVAGHWEAFLSAYCKGGDRAVIRRYNRAIDRKAAAIRRHSLRKRRRQAAQRPPA